MSKDQKNPFVHPSMAKPAQRGQSRIVPGAKPGAHHVENPPPDPYLQGKMYSVGTPDMEDEWDQAPAQEQRPAPEAEKPERPKSQAQSPQPQGELSDRKNSVVSKLLMFKEPMYKTAKISDMLFKFKVLTPSETMHVAALYQKFKENDRTIYRGRILSLAASLVDIDGVRLEDAAPNGRDSDPVIIRYNELMSWNGQILDAVLEARDKAMEDVKKEYIPDFLDQGR